MHAPASFYRRKNRQNERIQVMQLIEDIERETRARKLEDAEQWSRYDALISRAHSPEAKDAIELVSLAGRLSIPIAEVKAAAYLSLRAHAIRENMENTSRELKDLHAETKTVNDLNTVAVAALRRAVTERDRILNDVPTETAKLRTLVDAVVALADTRPSGARDAFLKSRGWKAVMVPTHVGNVFHYQREGLTCLPVNAVEREAMIDAAEYLTIAVDGWKLKEPPGLIARAISAIKGEAKSEPVAAPAQNRPDLVGHDMSGGGGTLIGAY